MNRFHKLLPVICLCAAGLAGPAHALTLVTERTDAFHPNGKATNTMYLDGEHMRIETERPDRGQEVIIFDTTARKLFVISPERKTYSEMTPEDMQRMRGQMDEKMAQMQEKMKDMPPERRK